MHRILYSLDEPTDIKLGVEFLKGGIGVCHNSGRNVWLAITYFGRGGAQTSI